MYVCNIIFFYYVRRSDVRANIPRRYIGQSGTIIMNAFIDSLLRAATFRFLCCPKTIGRARRRSNGSSPPTIPVSTHAKFVFQSICTRKPPRSESQSYDVFWRRPHNSGRNRSKFVRSSYPIFQSFLPKIGE